MKNNTRENPGMPGTKQYEDFCRKKLKPIKYICFILFFLIFLFYSFVFLLFSKIPYVGELLGIIAFFCSHKIPYKLMNSFVSKIEYDLKKKYNIPENFNC